MIAVFGRGKAGEWYSVGVRVLMAEYWQEALGLVPTPTWLSVAEDDLWAEIPAFEGQQGVYYDEGVRRVDGADVYLCTSAYTTGPDPLPPGEDPDHWRKLQRGLSPSTMQPNETTGYAFARIRADEVIQIAVNAAMSGPFAYLPPIAPGLGQGSGVVSITAWPTGVPPTGQTTSYHAGDDGDLRAGGGVLPVTGQTTSHHDGDDGDLQAGFKGE